MTRLQVAPVRASASEISAELVAGGRRHRFGFEYSVPVAASGDFALPVALLPSMAFRRPLRVESPVDSGMLTTQARIQDLIAGWDSTLARIEVSADERPQPSRRSVGVAAFFSGGIDSFYTVLRQSAELTHLILIHGFDVSLGDRGTRERIASMVHGVGRDLGLEVIEVETDAKQVASPFVHWRWFHGGLLAGVAQALEAHVGRVLIPATHAYGHLVPWGSHPDLDPRWSSARVRLEHDGAEATRVRKAALVAGSELAMRSLRVCWREPGEWNCGRCEKCIRTMLNLAACGALGECRTLPDRLDPDEVRALVLRDENDRMFARENLEGLRHQEDSGELEAALEVALRRSRYRGAKLRVKRLPAGVARRARHWRRRLGELSTGT